MSVPPMQFSVKVEQWESYPNRLPSRHISVEKHEALTKMIDDLLELQVIQPSKATAWSQVHLIRKPTGGWRFTVDYRGLNKVISNEGWQIPNMRDMLMRIGHQRPKCFAVADLTSGFFSNATTRNVSQIYCIHIISWNIRMDAGTYGFTSVC